MARFDEYTRYDALGLADLVRRREVSPVELVEAAIARIDRLDGELNAVVCRMFDEARAAAEAAAREPAGPFAGVPFLVKDLIQAVRNVPLTSASRMTKGYVPQHDGELVKRYRRAGLVLLGKTNTPELGIPPYTEPELFGPTKNPWNLERSPGGSSGGSAAAVAARLVPMAHGGDGGGSIRIPASCCGVFGLKPTRARTPAGPDHGDNWQGCAVEHVLSRSVRDSAAALDATAGPDGGAPYFAPPPSRPFLDEVTAEPGKLRVAFTSYPLLGGEVSSECKAALEGAAKLVKSLGHHVEEARPVVDRPAFTQAFVTMLAAETAADVADAEKLVGRAARRGDFEATTWVLAQVGKHVSAAEYAGAIRALRAAARMVAPFFDRYDVLMTPTLARPPVRIGELQAKGVEAMLLRALERYPVGAAMRALLPPLADKSFEWTPFTPVFNATGQPAMSVPLAQSRDGLPIGIHFVGRYGDEACLLRLAGQLERAAPWADRAPAGFD